MAGRIRSQRRDTVGWLTPKTAPARSWVMLLRISATTIATDRYSPIAAGPAAWLGDAAGDGRHPGGQRGQLPGREPCNSLVPQRLLP